MTDCCNTIARRLTAIHAAVLKRIPTLQLILFLFGHSSHQGFIASGSETLGTEQHHVATNAALNSNKVLDDHLGVINITDIGGKITH